LENSPWFFCEQRSSTGRAHNLNIKADPLSFIGLSCNRIIVKGTQDEEWWQEPKKKLIKLHDLSPLANYIDRATAACWRSDYQLLADRVCHVVSVTDPYGRILGFRDRSRYFSIK
jgi:hypothetical protein